MISCKEYVELEKEKLKAKGLKRKLDIFQVGDNPASNAYIKGKLKDCEEVGIEAELHKFDEDVHEWDVEKEILNAVGTSDGIIIQLPVPDHIDADSIMERRVMSFQDVDGFVYDAHDPCTPKGIINWLEYNKVNLDGANVVIIGRSNIVGKPLAKMMTDRNATVTLCHSHTITISDYCKLADIIILATGKPKWFSFNATDKKPIIIDVGINRDENGKLCGDVDREYMEAQGCYVTPVPGGVGLLTRLALLQNILED